MQDKDKFYFIHHLNATTDVAFYIQNNFNNVLLVSLFFAFFFSWGVGGKKVSPPPQCPGKSVRLQGTFHSFDIFFLLFFFFFPLIVLFFSFLFFFFGFSDFFFCFGDSFAWGFFDFFFWCFFQLLLNFFHPLSK